MDDEIPTFTAFPLLQQGHILKGLDAGRSVGMCGVMATTEVETKPIRLDDPGLCPACRMEQAMADCMDEPIEDALARGVERVELRD